MGTFKFSLPIHLIWFVAFPVFVASTALPLANGSDTDAAAYISVVGLTGDEAATVERIVLELKGAYTGSGQVNTSETDYWSDLTDAWLFDRGLNINDSGVAYSLMLDHNVSLNVPKSGAVIDTVDGLVTEEGSIQANGDPGAEVVLSATYGSGMTFLANEDPGASSGNGGYWVLGITGAGDGHANSQGNSIVFKANGGGGYLLDGFDGGSSGLIINPMSNTGSGFQLHWVSASSAGVSYAIGGNSGSDSSIQFGSSGNNFSPTSMRWGWTRLYTAGTSVAYGETKSLWRLLLNRTTTAAERDELAAIMELFVTGGSDTEAPSVPANLSSGSVTSSSFTLSWDASTDNVGVTEYEVFQDGNSVDTTTGTSLNLSGLSASTSYEMTVRARDAAGNWSPETSTFNVTTNAAGDTEAPSVPANLSSGSVTSSSFTLSWDASTDNVGVTEYEVFQDGNSVDTTTGTSLNLSGLTASTSYEMTVRARDAAGNWSQETNAFNVTTSSSGGGDITTGLLGWWKFDESSGTSAADSSGNNHTGTLANFGGTPWVGGQTGNALDFDGSNDVVTIGNPSALQLTGAMTVAAWVNVDTITDNGRIITKGGGSGNRGWELNLESNDEWAFQIASDTSTHVNVTVSGIPIGSWVHVAGVYDPSVPVLRLYLDGVLAGERTSGVPSSMFNSSQNVAIGRRAVAATPFDGTIDEARIYSRALSTTDIATLAGTGGGSNTAPTISSIANQTIDENTNTGALAFTVGDAETAVGSLTVSASSANTALVPVENITFGGSGASRTVTVTPAANQTGTATITVTVSDGTDTADEDFDVLVSAPSNTPPTISGIADQTIDENTNTGAIAFTVGDAETAVGSLTLSATSTDTTLVPVENITFGGSGASRTVTVTPAANQTGTSTITVTVSDGTDTADEEFVLTVDEDPPSGGGDITTGLLGWWKFDESSGTSAADSSGNNHTGTLANFGGSPWVGGQTGNALDFDGSNDVVTIGNPSALQLTGAMTVAAWVNVDTITGSGRIITKGGGSGNRGWELNLESNNEWAFQIASNTSTLVNVTVSGIPIGSWVHVAGVYDPSVPVLRLYLDGVLAGERTSGVPSSMFNSSQNVAIGRRAVAATPFDGTIDEARIYSRALSTTDIATLAGTGGGSNTAPTISSIANQTIDENTNTGALAFTVGDAETAAGSLTLSATSTNTTLVPVENITFGGSGASRTVTVTPAANQTGTATITVTVSDGTDTVDEDFDVIVNQVGGAPVLTSASTANGTYNAAFSYTITASNTPTSYGASGLPSGLTVSTTTGLISGTPTASGTFNTTISATNAFGTDDASLEIIIAKASATVTLSNLSHTYDGSSKSATATTSPAGLTVDITYNGSGTAPSAVGSYAVVATVNETNYQGSNSGTLAISAPGSPPTVTSSTVAGGTYLAAFSYTITGSNSPTSFDATGLPSGLSVNTSSGLISGTPTESGTFNATISATNSFGTGNAGLTITIAKAAATVTLSGLSHTYDGTPKSATVATSPSGLTVAVTYDGSATAPSAEGSYAVVATINEANYQGSNNGTLIIAEEAPPSLPYQTGFESGESYSLGLLDGKGSWFSGSGTTVASGGAVTTGQSVSLSGGIGVAHASQDFVGTSGLPIVFVSLWAKPVANVAQVTSTQIDTEAATVSAFKSGSLGQLHVWQGNGSGGGAWEATDYTFPINGSNQANDWHQITVRQDYTKDEWDLYVADAMIVGKVGFNDNTLASFATLSIDGPNGGTGRIDDVFAGVDNPLFTDADRDGIDDAYETANGMSTAADDRDGDIDQDELTNLEEFILGTRADIADTDGDGLNDKWEVVNGTDPLDDESGSASDADSDGFSDLEELAHGFNPLDPTDAAIDSDGDGTPDLEELLVGSDPYINQFFSWFASPVPGASLPASAAVMIVSPQGTLQSAHSQTLILSNLP